jgi:hypothetical protein
MIFNSKQLEELENIHDSTGAFEEEGDDEGGLDDVGEAAMDWRRGLIEEAAENIKRAKTRPVESHLTYPIGSMLFERDARRFARVQRSVPGYLKIVYLSGGDREFGTLDVTGYLRDYGAEKRLSELSEQLGMSDVDVATELERLGITPLEEAETEAAAEETSLEAAAAPPVPPLAPAPARAGRPPVSVLPVGEDDLNDDHEDESDEDQEDGQDDVEDAELDADIDVDDDGEAPRAVVQRGHGKASALTARAQAGSARPAAKASTGKPAAELRRQTTTKTTQGTITRGKVEGQRGSASTKTAPTSPPAPVSQAVSHSVVPSRAAAPATKAGAPKGRAPAPTKTPAPSKASSTAPAKAAKAAPPKSPDGKLNPIDDPNSYIKAHYQELSNRELARLTGLSEHTIRRKLGEWGMRRKTS